MKPDAKWQHRAERYRRDRGAAGGRRTTHYLWRVDPGYASRTRKDHLALNGRKFRWDDPPVVNPRTGEKGHPGMDGHCRCWAEPVPD